MLGVFDDVTIGHVVGVVTGAGIVLGGLKWTVPYVRAWFNFLTDWRGEPERPGVERRPGVLERLEDLTLRLDVVGERLERVEESAAVAAFNSAPNHGSSAHDALANSLARVEADLAGLRLAQTEFAERLDAIQHN